MYDQSNRPFFLTVFNWNRLIERTREQSNLAARDLDPDHKRFSFAETKEAIEKELFSVLMEWSDDSTFPTSAYIEEIVDTIQENRRESE